VSVLAPCTVPARARRIGGMPTPRIRPLAEVLSAQPRPRSTADPDDGARIRRAQDELDRVAAALRPLAARLLTAVADVLAGRRPAADLGPLLAPDALATLVRATQQPQQHDAQRSCGAGGRTQPGPPRSRPAPAPGTRTPRAGLRGLRVCAVAPRAAEVVAVVHGHDRVRALAARLERVDEGPADPGRWRVVALWPG